MGLLGLFVLALMIWLVAGVWSLLRLARRPPSGAAATALASGAPIDLESAGLEGEIWMLQASDGVDLPVYDIQGAGEDPIVLVFHDWGEAPLTMFDRASELAKTAQRVVLPTLRAHDAAGGRCTLGSREITDGETLLDTLDQNGVVLEGRGLGGRIARALRDHQRVVTARVEDPWIDRRDGLRRILARQGMPAVPIASLAGWVWPERRERRR